MPLRLLNTHDDDVTPLYDRPFRCWSCGRQDVQLFAIESQSELDQVRPLPSYKPKQDRGITSPGSRDYEAEFL